MKIVNKEDNKTRRTIYEEIYENYFKEATVFPDDYIEQYKNNPNAPHNIFI